MKSSNFNLFPLIASVCVYPYIFYSNYTYVYAPKRDWIYIKKIIKVKFNRISRGHDDPRPDAWTGILYFGIDYTLKYYLFIIIIIFYFNVYVASLSCKNTLHEIDIRSMNIDHNVYDIFEYMKWTRILSIPWTNENFYFPLCVDIFFSKFTRYAYI